MTELDWHQARAALEWQIELGAEDAIGEDPIDRFELPAKIAKPKVAEETAPMVAPQKVDAVSVASEMAKAASTLEELKTALASYDYCDLRKGARNLVFSDGVAGSDVMVIGEAPGRDEDQAGKPFVGRAGQLLDKMLAAIGLDRAQNVYITNVLPWRPPQNRDPKPDEIAMMQPFVHRHIELADPKVLVLMGNHSCMALLNKRGITKLRGDWDDVGGRPAMPMFHPAYLVRQPLAKRDAWNDLLAIKSKLGS